MKNLACILLTSLVFAGCNYHQQQQQIKDLTTRDSAMLQQSLQKDSSITAYIHSLNDIQDNLNAIKEKEHLISVARENGTADRSASIVADIRSLDSLILKNHKEIAVLEGKLRYATGQDVELKKMVANFQQELNDKTVEIAELEGKLTKSDDSLRLVVKNLNDSVNVINRDAIQMGAMRTEMNTIHYAIGTYKELKDHGVVEKQGSFIGIGGVPELKANFNKGYFTTAQMPDLQTIPLYGKFDKLVTYHPSASYKIVGGEKVNSLVITDPDSFWSTSKYLVIVITEQQKSSGNEAGILPEPEEQ